MRPVLFVVPGPLDTRTGGFIYDRQMVERLPGYGWSVSVCELDGSFPRPSRAAVDHARARLADTAEGTMVIIDGLALSTLPDLVEREAPRLLVVALVHLPLAADITTDRAISMQIESDERRALSASRLIVVTGTTTVAMLDRYAIASDRIAIVEPGTDPATLMTGSGHQDVALLCAAALTPGKGHEILFHALAQVPSREWHLTCAGSTLRSPAWANRLRVVIHSLGLDDHVRLTGELDTPALAERYDQSDVFVLATRQETYGMAVADALARGMPVVASAVGAIPDLVGDDAGVLVPPGDVDALSDALARIIEDPALRARLAQGARRVRGRLPSWDTAVAKMHHTLMRVYG